MVKSIDITKRRVMLVTGMGCRRVLFAQHTGNKHNNCVVVKVKLKLDKCAVFGTINETLN